MSKELLDRFFKENKAASDNATAPAFAHYYLSLENDPEANKKMQDTLSEAVFSRENERKEKALAEKNEIDSAENYEQVIRFMRRQTDPVNRHEIVNKAMEFENEIVPEIVRLLKTSLNDGFIEKAIRILARSKMEFADELIGYYDDMRYPYAQSMALVLLGFKADESRVSWLIEKYEKLKRLYPKENYCDGAYYALLEIQNRFYPSGKK